MSLITDGGQGKAARLALACLALHALPLTAAQRARQLVPLGIATTAMPAYDSQRAPYSFRFTPSGGTAPYSWSCTGLPAGLSCDSAGNVTGTTAAANGPFSVDVTVSDATPSVIMRTLPLQVYTTPAILTPPPLPEGYLGISYGSLKLQAAGVSGAQSWAITAGGMPPGMYFDGNSGSISGTPTALGDIPFTVELTDGAAVVSANYTLTVSNRIVPPYWLRRGLSGGTLDPMVFSPLFALDKTIVAIGRGRIYLSQDGGYFWSQLGFQPPAGSFAALALPPDFDGRPGGNRTILAAVNGGNALYRSTDLGQNWTALPAAAPASLDQFGLFAYDPGIPGRVLAYVADSGVRKIMATTDLVNWNTVKTITLGALVMSPSFAVDRTFFASQTFGKETNQLLRSTDGGANFQTLASGSTQYFASIAMSPNFAVDRTVAYIDNGLAISFDGGNTFTKAGLFQMQAPIAFPADFNLQSKPWIYAVAGGYASPQLVLSRDAGLTFNPTGTGGMPTAAFSGNYQLSPTFGQDKTIIARGNSGMFRSENAGATWGPADSGLYLQRFNCAAFAPNPAGTLFAGTDQGVYYSTNGGLTWRLSVAGNKVAWPMSISTLAVSPNFAVDRTVFAFAFDYARFTGNVLRSTDGGVTFDNPSGDFQTSPYTTRERLAVSPDFGNDHRVFMTVGLYSGLSNFYISYDSGVNYIAVGPPFSGAENVNEAGRFAVSPSYATDRTIYLNNRSSSTWTLRSTDTNNILFYLPPPAEPWPNYSWLAPVLSPDYNHNAAPSGSNKTIFVGCQKTADDGVSFSPVPVCGNVYLAPTYPATDLLFVTDNGNNYYDGGTGLFRHSAAIPAYTALTPPAGGSFGSVGQVAFSPAFASDSTLLVAGGGGLYLSTNAGDTFTVMTGGDSFSAQITTVAPDPNSPNRLFIGTSGSGVAQSLDDGASALPITGNLPAQPVRSLLAVGNPTALLAALPSGIWRRTDFTPSGSWSLRAPGDMRSFNPDPAGGRSYAARSDGASLVSADDGLNWSPLAGSLADASEIFRVQGAGLAPAPGAPNGSAAPLWAASLSGGARWSNDNGASWTAAPGTGDYLLPAGGGWSAVRALGVNAQSGGREVVIGNSSQGLFLTRDGGDSWRRVSGTSSGLEATSQNISAMLTAGTAYGTTDLLAGVYGTTNGGVYLSGDGGEHWTQINQGFDPNNLNITTLVRTSCGGCPVQYYSGTYGSGMYTRTISVNPPPTFPSVNAACFGSTGCSCVSAAGSGPEQGGQSFRLCGANFQTQPVIEFDRIPATGCVMVSSTVITCTGTPAHPPGSVSIRVRNTDTRAGALPNGYTYAAGTPRAIAITKITKGGAGGNDAMINWTCLGGACASQPVQLFRTQNAAFTLNLEHYTGTTGVTGIYANTGALAAGTNATYFWKIE